MDQDTRASFLAQLATTAAGRQHMLSIAVDAEEGDEGGIFDQLADVVDDPKLRRLVERHRDDEARHAQLFRGCLARLGLEKRTVPEELQIIRRIASGAGDAATTGPGRGVHTTADVVATYALLHAIEQRGVEQFPVIADAFRPIDPETADVYLQVARDERGHVRYCETIGRHYATDDDEWQTLLEVTRGLESQAFDAVTTEDLAYCTDHGWIDRDWLDAKRPVGAA